MTDCLIAAIALRHGLTLLHRDRDFEALAKVSALSVRRVRARDSLASIERAPELRFGATDSRVRARARA